jgi:hypothetical protein
MNEKTIDQIEEEVLSYEASDEAAEAAGTTEIAGAWTFVCTGVECNHTVSDGRAASKEFACVPSRVCWFNA